MPYSGTLSGFGIAGQQPQTSAVSSNSSGPSTGYIQAGRPPGRAFVSNSYSTSGGRPVGTVNQATIPDYVPTVFTETCQDVYVQEKHVSVIRKGPTAPPTLEMFSYTRADLNSNGLIDIEKIFDGGEQGMMVGHFPLNGGNTIIMVSVFYDGNGERKEAGDDIVLPILDTAMDWLPNDVVVIAHEFVDANGIKQRVSCKVVINGFPEPPQGNLLQCTLLTTSTSRKRPNLCSRT
jgi:hypothetical protein